MKSYKAIVPETWLPKYTFSPAVKHGNLIFLSGTTATDEAGNIVGPGDIVAQTRRIFEKFDALLRMEGAS
uniref:RidA family protein n=1 Tax=Escherichia coli TaxID=562 RepID=UPI0013D79133